MDTSTILVFVLAVLGLAIIVSEVFIPSAGILSLMALGCFAGSAFCAWKSWYQTEQYGVWWTYVFSMVLGIPAVICAGLYMLPRTAFGKALLAAPQDLDEVTPFQDEEVRLSELIDRTGEAMTMFSPGGMVQIGRDRLHAETEGVLIDPGTEVIVVGVKGNRLVVRPTSLESALAATDTQAASGTPSSDEAVPDPDSEDSRIDFDVPEST